MKQHIIYELISPVGKSYIGQSNTTLEARLKQHKNALVRFNDSETKRGFSTKLYYAMNTYPEQDWKKVVLETVDSNIVDEREMYYIQLRDSINNGYNITKGGRGRKVDHLDDLHKENMSKSRKEFNESEEGKQFYKDMSIKNTGEGNPRFGVRYNHKEETKELMRKNSIGKNKGKVPWNKGIAVDPEVIARMKETKKIRHEAGMYDYSRSRYSAIGNKQSEHQKQTAAKTFSKNWEITSPNKETFTITNLLNFCREHNLDQGNLSRGSHKGWKAKRIDD